MSAGHLFIFGYGYVAAALAKSLLAAGWQVSGTARDARKRKACAPLGIQLTDPADQGAVAAALAHATHVLCCVPPGRESGDPMLRMFEATLTQATPALQWLGYCSTTGVYGNTQGAWVDETTPPAPDNQRGHLRMDAEHGWARVARTRGVPLAIFRIAGIYGPGRSAIDQLRAGEARRIMKPGQVFSRAHVVDIAGIIAAAMAPKAAGVFNIADAEPAPAHEVVAFAAELTGLPLPPEEDAASAPMSAMLREFYSSCRRVKPARASAELGYQWRYPTYREGLQAQWSMQNTAHDGVVA